MVSQYESTCLFARRGGKSDGGDTTMTLAQFSMVSASLSLLTILLHNYYYYLLLVAVFFLFLPSILGLPFPIKICSFRTSIGKLFYF